MAMLVRFPKVAANIEEGMVGAWRKREGERVAKDEPLVELITDKATFELPAEADGTLLRIFAAEKSTVPVNFILAAMGAPGEPAPDVAAENDRLLALHRTRAAASWQLDVDRLPGNRGRERIRATPSARRLAREKGIDLAKIAPRDGQVIRDQDVQRQLSEGVP